ncbi:myb family transcription factor EFM-like [Diospyros lotus]|uniref:myb family transcription factor EFM-like n=1 Tax=Diospyros lotus TaxID=55363 RepID=UPI00224F0692|nr:myb family transcription factor EFM-like [Diospyros lotus]
MKMGSIPPELSLDIRPTYVAKTITDFLAELAAIRSASDRLVRIDDFVSRLEDEMRKIDAFKRELPLCMLLLTDAIGTLKEESVKCRARNVEPVLEEFIPLKRKCDRDNDKSEDKKEKMNWMSSVQLWNSDDHKTTDPKRENQKQMNSLPQFIKGAGEECDFAGDDPFQSAKKGNGLRAFMPFKGCSVFPAMPGKKEENKEEEFPIPGLSLLTPGIKNPRGEVSCSSSIRPKTSANRGGSSSTPNAHSGLRAGPQLPHQQTPRKQRRCWSPELHRRFVNALQQLGGSQVATPKQIRELMQVDGLTNDEVKSHLQKYRLHTRRLPTTASTPAANQSVAILGGLWMPHDQYGESSKQSSSQSGSPQGPLQLAGAGGGTSTTGGDSMEEEEEEKSESYGWRSHIQKPGKDDV